MRPYFVYLLCCADQSYYTGITTDLERRLAEHNSSSKKGKGAHYTRSRQPVTLGYVEEQPDRSSALIREHSLRKLSHLEKEVLINKYQSS